MKAKGSFPALLLAMALSLGLLAAPASAAAGRVPVYNVELCVDCEAGSGKTDVGKGIAIASGVLRGDNTGALNWDKNLTRAEAATMLVRLLGMEDKAQAAKSQPSAFSDVPEWANGYVNVAVAEGLAKGVGNGMFSPSTPCRAQDFITMLYRMTNLTEGVDFSWGTALADLVRDAKAITMNYQGGNYWTNNIGFWSQAVTLESYFRNGGAFTREAACDVIYFMLNIKAGPDNESLGDLLSAGYGMSDMLLFNYSVRRTGYPTKGAGQAERDYAYYYAYRSGEHFTGLAKTQGDYEITPEIQALAGKLTAGKATELAKADAICQWVATHIYYDYPTNRKFTEEFWHKQLPSVVLETRLAVCQGYSQLTYALMQAAGLECYQESGKGNGQSHGWNVARLDGKWVVMDNTWDSPLEYGKTMGSGYQCRYDDPELVWVWRTPDNIMEPGASRRMEKVHFNMDLDKFYSTHKLLRDPLFVNRTVLTIDSIKGL